MKKLLLISNDEQLCNDIRGFLGTNDVLTCVSGTDDAVINLRDKASDLVIIDNDFLPSGGIEAFKAIKNRVPRLRAMMISKAGKISLAVEISKLGALSFLSKPLNKEKFIDSLEKICEDRSLPFLKVMSGKGCEWLEGQSSCINDFISRAEEAVRSEENIMLTGGFGAPLEYSARLIHDNSSNSNRRFVKLELSSFEKESLESMFWTTMREIMSHDVTSGAIAREEKCGTLYLEGFDILPEHFQKSILEYFGKSLDDKSDKDIRVIIGANKNFSFAKKYADDRPAGFLRLDVPDLKERKEDVGFIVNAYIRSFCQKYNKNINGMDPKIFDIFALHDWPGNYDELRCLIDCAVLKCRDGMITINDLQMDFEMILKTSIKASMKMGDWTLSGAYKNFRKNVIKVILSYCGDDANKAAKFLDLPKTAFVEELEDLEISA